MNDVNGLKPALHKQHFLFQISLYTHTSICHITWKSSPKWLNEAKTHSELKQERKLKPFSRQNT